MIRVNISQAKLLLAAAVTSGLSPEAGRSISEVHADLAPTSTGKPSPTYGKLYLAGSEAKALAEALQDSPARNYAPAQLETLGGLLESLEAVAKTASKVTLDASLTEKACLACRKILPASEFYAYQSKGQMRPYARCKSCIGERLLAKRSYKQSAEATATPTACVPSTRPIPSELAVGFHISAKEWFEAYRSLSRSRPL